VLVYIHGGGWAGGKKADLDKAIRGAAARGYLTVSVGYRLAPKHLFPAQVEDVKCAVRWLRAHADELGIDPERIGAVGFSAGAHLAMMLGFMDKDDGLEGEGGWPDQSSKVQVVVAYFGPTNLDDEYPEVSKNIVKQFIGGTREDKRDVYRRASPATYINSGDSPVLIFQGTSDVLVPHNQAIQIVDALAKAGVPGRIEIMLGANHGWGGQELDRTLEATAEFFDERLKPVAP
jgi:acetyl esterase/lipase